LEIITQLSQLSGFMQDLGVCNHIGFDVEATTLDPYTAKLILVQVELNNNIYILNVEELNKNDFIYIIDLLLASNKLVIGHNLKYDLKIILHNSGKLFINIYDTMVAETLLHIGLGYEFYSLADLVKKYCGITLNKEIRDQFIEENYIGISDNMVKYAADDVVSLFAIHQAQLPKILGERLDNTVALEMLLVPVLAYMEYEGIFLDKNMWMELDKQSTENALIIRKELKELIIPVVEKAYQEGKLGENMLTLFDGLHIPVKTKKNRKALEEITAFEFCKDKLIDEFNINSWRQMHQVFSLMGVNADSTNEKKLIKYSHSNPVVKKLLDYREQFKRSTSFGETFLNNVSSVSGKLHPTINQMGTVSGRTSEEKPNLQQIVRGSKYRQCFRVDSDDWLMGSFDYSQQELRIVGAISGEPKFIQAFQEGKDIHTLTASIIFGKSIEDVTPDERQLGKTINFAVVYGTTEYGLNYNFGIALEVGEEYLRKYFETYEYLAEFKRVAGEKIWELGYSVTPNGRRRYFEQKIMWENAWEYKRYKERVIREGVNHIIQGGGADITKMAMCGVFYNNPFRDKLRMLMIVHDEIVAKIHKSVVDLAVPFITDCMIKAEQPFLGVIPAEVTHKIDTYWSK
jgi:DNA polymerase-1